MSDEYYAKDGLRVVNQTAPWFPVPALMPCQGQSHRVWNRFHPKEQPVFATVGISAPKVMNHECPLFLCEPCRKEDFPEYGCS